MFSTIFTLSHQYLLVVGTCVALVTHWLGTWPSVPATYTLICMNDTANVPALRGHTACVCVVWRRQQYYCKVGTTKACMLYSLTINELPATLSAYVYIYYIWWYNTGAHQAIPPIHLPQQTPDASPCVPYKIINVPVQFTHTVQQQI